MADPIPTGRPFTWQVVHDGLNTTSYKLTQNGAVVATKPFAAGGVAFPFPTGLQAGTYTFTVTAVGPSGETVSPVETLIIVVAAPSQPHLTLVLG